MLIAFAEISNFLAQTAQTGGGTDWVSILASYGVAAPFALLCLYFIRELRIENKELRGRLVDSFIPALTISNKLHTDTAEVLNKTTALVQQITSAPGPTPREIEQATDALLRAIDLFDTAERAATIKPRPRKRTGA